MGTFTPSAGPCPQPHSHGRVPQNAAQLFTSAQWLLLALGRNSLPLRPRGGYTRVPWAMLTPGHSSRLHSPEGGDSSGTG